ncbi:hypothetical protein ACS0TY_029672 [Phlomoides rotata]
MAAVAGSHSLFCTDNNLISAKGKREHASYDAITPPIRRNLWIGGTGSTLAESTTIEPSVLLGKQRGLRCPSINKGAQKQKYCMVTKAMRSEKHLNSLNSYLGKLHHDDIKKPSSKSLNDRIGDIDELKAENGLRSLESYLDKAKGGNKLDSCLPLLSRPYRCLTVFYFPLFVSLIPDVQSENYIDKDIRASISNSGWKDQGSGRERSFKTYMELKIENSEGKEISNDEASDFYLIGALASINIAVFLFDIATPVKSSYFELVSLPMVYGAKINDLILTGEWWRLVTPMFLVQD